MSFGKKTLESNIRKIEAKAGKWMDIFLFGNEDFEKKAIAILAKNGYERKTENTLCKIVQKVDKKDRIEITLASKKNHFDGRNVDFVIFCEATEKEIIDYARTRFDANGGGGYCLVEKDLKP